MLDFQKYMNQVYGCFLGKTVVGTLGAPYEGIKMPQTLTFKSEMLNTMLPNDDLDLQVLWLDVLEEYGMDFTSYDLLERFVTHCDYSPGEYAVMRKNFERGVYPPLSGKFSNDYYIQGMGCPIRSEIWACVFPAAPDMAASFSTRDGVLDHQGESVYAEQFFAALESAAFEESNLRTLIDIAFTYIPQECKVREVLTNTIKWCDTYQDISLVLRELLFHYGHPDCTNLFQNIGITLSALLLGDLDLIKTGMLALNCGFDTDCTCATAGAIIGAIRGAESLIQEYNLPDIQYVLGVESNRRSTSVRDLSEDICHLAVVFHPEWFSGAPVCKRTFIEHPMPLSFSVSYEEDDPTISLSKPCKVLLKVRNETGEKVEGPLHIKGLNLDQDYYVQLGAFKEEVLDLEFHVPKNTSVLYEKNIIFLDFKGIQKWSFGIIGRAIWKVVGPIWKTDPVCTTEKLLKYPSYWKMLEEVPYDGDPTDVVRRFHLNFAIDPDTEYFHEKELRNITNENQKAYMVSTFEQQEDSFEIQDICGFKGPGVFYLIRDLWSDKEMNVCVQIGHSAPVKLWLNGKELCKRVACDTWDAENIHLQNIPLKKGKNTLILRLTQVNRDAKFNLIFSTGATCATHYVCFGTAL